MTVKLRLEIEISEKTFDALFNTELNFRQKMNSVPGALVTQPESRPVATSKYLPKLTGER